MTPYQGDLDRRIRAAEIARELCRSMGEQVARQLEAGHFPPEWDGHEVRALLCSEFAREMSDLMRLERSKGRGRWRRFVKAAAEGMSRRHEISQR